MSDAIGYRDHGLDLLNRDWDGRLFLRRQNPGRVGYKNTGYPRRDWRGTSGILEEGGFTRFRGSFSGSGSNGRRRQRKNLYIIGGEVWTSVFSPRWFSLPGCRALLYRNLDPGFFPLALMDVNGRPKSRAISAVDRTVAEKAAELGADINWTPNAASAETFHAMPLLGRNKELLGVSVGGSSRKRIGVADAAYRYDRGGRRGCGDSGRVAAELVGGGAHHAAVESWPKARAKCYRADGTREIDVRGTDEIGQLEQPSTT